MGGAGSNLEAGDGVLSRLAESLVDPGHDGVIRHLLSITQVLQDVEGVPEQRTSFVITEGPPADVTTVTFS